MATYTEIKLVDDLDGGPGDHTVEFGLDGRDYEIDLSDANAQRLRDALAEFVANGRKAGRPEKPGKPEKPGRRRHDDSGNGGGKLDRDEAGAIRDWVRQHGGEINDRGRVPRKYVDAYHNDDTSIFEGGGDSDETPEPEPVSVGEPFGAQPHF